MIYQQKQQKCKHSSDNSANIYSDQSQCGPKIRPRAKTFLNSSDKCANIVKHKIKISRNPFLDKHTWVKHDKEFESINEGAWNTFKKGRTTPEQFISDINSSLASYLEAQEDFQKETKPFFQHSKPNKDHLEELRRLKIKLNKESKLTSAKEKDVALARQAVRTYSHALKVNKEKEKLSVAREEEKAYRKNFWKTAKEVTNGTFGQPESAPTFSKETAEKFFKDKG